LNAIADHNRKIIGEFRIKREHPPSLPYPQRGMECVQERRFAEGLEQAFDGSIR